MRIEKLWVVVRPGPESELGDVCFAVDVKGLALQFKGGLDPEDIHAVYTSMNEAQREADRILTIIREAKIAFEQGQRLAREERKP